MVVIINNKIIFASASSDINEEDKFDLKEAKPGVLDLKMPNSDCLQFC